MNIEQAQLTAKANDKRIVEFKPSSDGVSLVSSGYDKDGLAVCNIYKSFDSSLRPELKIRYTITD
jgi:hypothetical protein